MSATTVLEFQLMYWVAKTARSSPARGELYELGWPLGGALAAPVEPGAAAGAGAVDPGGASGVGAGAPWAGVWRPQPASARAPDRARAPLRTAAARLIARSGVERR